MRGTGSKHFEATSNQLSYTLHLIAHEANYSLHRFYDRPMGSQPRRKGMSQLNADLMV